MAHDNSQAKVRPISYIDLRVTALKIIGSVLRDQMRIEDAIEKEVSDRERNHRPWLMDVVSGVLRNKSALDFIIAQYANQRKPTGKIERFLEIALYQIFFQKAEAAPVVSETVTAVRETEGMPPSKFVNAILRRITESQDDWKVWLETSPQSEKSKGFSEWCSLPEGLLKDLLKQKSFDEVIEFSQASRLRPDHYFIPFPSGEGRSVDDFSGIDWNEGYLQDRSNAECVLQVSEIFRKAGIKGPILDICSAPGGKSLGMVREGFSVIATDLSSDRLGRVRENRHRLKISEEKLRVVDYSELQKFAPFSAIWIDAPCTSSGVLKRHPEIRWNRSWKDISKTLKIQSEIRETAMNLLAPGGLLVWSTCSVLKQENPDTITAGKLLFSRDWAVSATGDGIGLRIFQKN